MRKRLTNNQIVFTVLLTLLAYAVVAFVLWLTVIRKNFAANSISTTIVYFILLASFFVVYDLFAYYADKQVLRQPRKLAAVYLVLIICSVVTYFTGLLNVNFVPYAMCTLVLTLLVGTKSAVFVNILSLIVTLSAGIVYGTMNMYKMLVCIFVGLVTVIICAFSSKTHNKRINYIFTGLFLGIVAVITTTIIYFLCYDVFNYKQYLVNIGYAFGGSIIDVTCVFLLVPLLERMFNITTDFRLAELTNVNQPLLKRLFNEAPGTFNHSMTVANYIEACAMAIGEDTYLARAVGYYHDIGKLRNPVYFSENQRDGYNPHNEIAPEVSVTFLKNHILYGVSLARIYRLPMEIERAIMEHHGTFAMKYFYQKAKKYTDGELSVRDYCYDGPTPTTKIDGMLMIVDACEATLRSLSVADKAKAEQVVENLVKERMDFGQFDNCDLTMKDLETIKQTIITTYMGSRHERVKYPEIKLASTITASEDSRLSNLN